MNRERKSQSETPVEAKAQQGICPGTVDGRHLYRWSGEGNRVQCQLCPRQRAITNLDFLERIKQRK